MSKAIIDWLANGETGLSSKCMAFAALAVKQDRVSHPYDPADFNRCLKLIAWAPEVLAAFPVIRELSPQWTALIDAWAELEGIFLDEVGFDWSKGRGLSATKTYKRMKQLGL